MSRRPAGSRMPGASFLTLLTRHETRVASQLLSGRKEQAPQRRGIDGAAARRRAPAAEGGRRPYAPQLARLPASAILPAGGRQRLYRFTSPTLLQRPAVGGQRSQANWGYKESGDPPRFFVALGPVGLQEMSRPWPPAKAPGRL